jgi:hypothetical protein
MLVPQYDSSGVKSQYIYEKSYFTRINNYGYHFGGVKLQRKSKMSSKIKHGEKDFSRLRSSRIDAPERGNVYLSAAWDTVIYSAIKESGK